MNALRRLRLELNLTQTEFAKYLGVAEETYRTWDSGRRNVPRRIIYLARRLKETDRGTLLPLQVLASEYHLHVRTLRRAAQDGRLHATFSTQMAFGKLVAFARREAVETFKRQYYRQTTPWNRPPKPPACIVPADYDRVVRVLRTTLHLTQSSFAVRIGAANKAVIYQWESKRRRPSPVLWARVEDLERSDAAMKQGSRD